MIIYIIWHGSYLGSEVFSKGASCLDLGAVYQRRGEAPSTVLPIKGEARAVLPMRGDERRGPPRTEGARTEGARMEDLAIRGEEMRAGLAKVEPSSREGSASGSASRFQMLLTRGAEVIRGLLMVVMGAEMGAMAGATREPPRMEVLTPPREMADLAMAGEARRGELTRPVPIRPEPRSREGSASGSASASRFQMLLIRGEEMMGELTRVLVTTGLLTSVLVTTGGLMRVLVTTGLLMTVLGAMRPPSRGEPTRGDPRPRRGEPPRSVEPPRRREGSASASGSGAAQAAAKMQART